MRRPLRRQRHRPKLSSRWLLAGASGLALGTTLLNVGQWFQAQAAASQDLCQEVKQSTATLSREQLAKLLAIAERSNRQEVKKLSVSPTASCQRWKCGRGPGGPGGLSPGV
jgi:hypothetical protein